MCHNGFRRFVQTQQLPAYRFIAHATTAHLPYSHDGVVFFGEAHGMNLDGSGIAVIPEFKNAARTKGFTSDLYPHFRTPGLRLNERYSLASDHRPEDVYLRRCSAIKALISFTSSGLRAMLGILG